MRLRHLKLTDQKLLNGFKGYIRLYSQGLTTGAVYAVPGVSTGTISFIIGVYVELLRSISAIDSFALRLLLNLKITDFWKKINGNFLITFFAGIATSIFFLNKWISSLTHHYPILILSFCFGVIFISSILLLRNIKELTISVVIFFFIGIALSYGAPLLPPTKLPDNYLTLFISGLLAAFAALIPGLSGTYILILMGKYHYLANARINFNIAIILIFTTGYLIGILAGSKLLTWLFDVYNNASIALFSGLMLGSLNKIWPWREILEYLTNNKGEQVPIFDKSVLPSNYFAATGKDPLIFQAVFMMALGVFVIVLIEKVAERIKTKI